MRAIWKTAGPGGRHYKHHLLIVLMLVLAFNYVDRLALGLLLQDVKTEFGLSDTQLGFLSGISFAAFYSTLGIPLARWADTGNRVTIVWFTTALWSAAVALCGLVTSYWQLLLVRVGVAVGEAGCIPTAHSLIGEHFPREERARATAIYMLGGPLSYLIGYFLAGWLNESYGWRVTFLMLGAPGLALAAIAAFTLVEPRLLASRGAERRNRTLSPPRSSIVASLRYLFAIPSFRHLTIALSLVYFFGYGIQQWLPSYFIRSFGLETGELGTWLALIHGLGGLIGIYAGGELAARNARANESLQLKAGAGAYLAFGVLSAGVYLATNIGLAFGLMAAATIGAAMFTGPLFGSLQSLVPAHMRALSLAVIYLLANLIGMGLGPLAAGVLSDLFTSAAGDDSLRYSLLVLCPGYAWAAWHLWRASRTIARDIAAQEDVNAAAGPLGSPP